MSGVRYLPLSQGKVAVIDADDFDRVGHFKWSYKESGKTGYAVRCVGGRKNPKRLWLHQVILGIPYVDHRDGDGLNNCRYNLRPSDSESNARAFRRKPVTSLPGLSVSPKRR
jgi:hypothetical protein